jgi:hypothetical protein
MNESPLHHAMLVLVMVALMLAGGLIESGRAPAPAGQASASVVMPIAVSAVSAVSAACDQAR